MNIIRRYFYSEVGRRLLWLFPLLISLLGIQRLIQQLARVLENPLPAEWILKIWILKLITVLPEVLTISMFLALMLSCARMQHDREILILSTSGLHLHKRVRLALEVGALTALAVAFACFLLVPWAQTGYDLLRDQIQEDIGVMELPPKQFLHVHNHTVYVEEVSNRGDDSVRGLFLYLSPTEQHQSIITAERGYLRGAAGERRWLELEQGQRYEFRQDSQGYQVLSFKRHLLHLPGTGETARRKSASSLGSALAERGPIQQANLQWRISQVLACLLLAPFAMMLYPPLPAGGRSYIVGLHGMGICFLYYALLKICEAMIERDQLPPEIGAWWLHLALLVLLLRRLRREQFPWLPNPKKPMP